jgi:tetratricopeptide (TPR) repeat protein
MIKTGKFRPYITSALGMAVAWFFLPAVALCFQITAQVDKTRITSADSIFLSVIVDGGKAQLDTSVITDFKVIQRGTSSSYQLINGRSERKTTYQFVLIPLAKGELTIPPIIAQMDGKRAQTQPILIQVVDNVVDPDQVKAIFAQAQISKKNLYVGQQAVYTIKFFTSKQLSGASFENPPVFNTLTAKAFDDERRYQLTIKGQTYTVIQLDYLIVPKRPGQLTIEPVSFIAKEPVRMGQSPGFNSIFSSVQYKPVRVVSNAINLHVMPLPEYDGTGEFSGLVGRFKLEAVLDRSRLKVGDSATLTITVTGHGNIMDAGPPSLVMDEENFKMYDDTPVDDIRLTPGGYQGSRTFKKALVPVREGRYQIPSMALICFNDDKNAYEKIISMPIDIEVSADISAQQTPLPMTSETNERFEKQDVSLLNQDILDIQTGLKVLEDHPLMNGHLFLMFLMIPGICFTLFKLLYSVKNKDLPSQKQMAQKAKHQLKLAMKLDTGDEAFLGHLYGALTSALLSKNNKKGESVSLDEARDTLTATSMDTTTVDQTLTAMQTIEAVRFGGRQIDEHAARHLLANVKTAIKHLICFMVVMLGLWTLPQPLKADVAGDFTRAVQLYQSGQYLQAAHHFEAVAAQKIRNPYLYYNLGNAYLKAGDIGQAVLWYERSKLIHPNNPDLVYNLTYANSRVKDKRSSGLDYMDLLFFWDKLVGIRTIQYTAIALSIVFFGWAGLCTVKRKPVFSGTGVLLLALLGLSICLFGVTYYKQAFVRTAVIVASEASVRSGTTDSATVLFSLHAGTKVNVRQTMPGYVKIEFSKDRVGWVTMDAIKIVQDIFTRGPDTKTVKEKRR